MSPVLPDARTALVDAAVAAWLACTSVVLLADPAGGHALRVGVHLGLVLLILALRGHVIRAGKTTVEAGFHALYPFLLLPFLYKELDVLAPICAGRTFDPVVQAWENALFGSSPALWLSQALPSRWLSEILHACYITFYGTLPALALYLLARRQGRAFQAVMWTAFGTFFLCYTVAAIFPVQGPRPLYPPLDPSLQGLGWSLSHALCAQGAANGAAFPSGHVAVSVVTALCAWRFARPLFPLFVLWAAGIALATVYGRYHYAVDVVAALPLAAGMAWLGPASYEWLTCSACEPEGVGARRAA